MMAELARRTGHGHGSDVVRRLIARPIRLQATMAADAVEARSMPSPAAQEPARETIAASPSADTDSARLKLEMTVLKAVLKAERRENASLRACVGLDRADATLGREARAVRDHWAALVDRLLHVPA